MNQQQSPNDTKQTVAFYWGHVCRYPRYVFGLLISVPLTVLVAQYLPPLIVATVLNRLSKGDFQPHKIWASFGMELVIYAVLILGGSLVGWRIVDALDWKLEGRVQRDMSQRVFSHLLEQSANFHANNFGGSLVSQTNKLLSSYIRLADTTVFQVLPLLSSLVFAALILAKRAPVFVVILLAFAVLYIISSFFVTRTVRRLSSDQATAESAQTGYLADAVTNIMAIKAFAGGAFEKRQFARATENTHNKLDILAHGHQRQQVYFSAMTNSISAVSLAMAVVGVMVLHANLATVFLILSYTSSIVGQLFTFSNNSLRNYNRAIGDASEMVKTLHVIPEVQDPVKPEKARITKGAITFQDVDFTHPDSGTNETLFKNLNITIKAGEKIGLVGHSGSGKTTLTKLLLRFNDIDAGEILIDGQNIAAITQDDLRRAIAYVPQEPLLFHRTIAENIRYGKPKATMKDVKRAAKRAHAEDFICTLPEGYETFVGERGVKLSGGQRQRIAIARAILKDAPILALDEATSALDSESEHLIQDALWKLMEGRTAIVIAHRLSTIQKMDRIIVLDHGTIIETGSHQQLLRNKGTYASLWARQSGGFLED